MLLRSEAQYVEEQRRRIRLLVREGMEGETKMDTLPNDAFPLKKEAEAMYFTHSTNFLRTSIAHRIMDVAQDVYGGN